MIILLNSAGKSSWFCWQSFGSRVSNSQFRVVACESWMVQFVHTRCQINFCWPFHWSIEDELILLSFLCGQRLSKNWILTLAANVQIRISLLPSFFGALSSVTDRVSDTAVEYVPTDCVLRITTVGINFFWRWGLAHIPFLMVVDEQMSNTRLPSRCPRALFRHFHGKSDYFDLPGITDCRCLRHFVLKRNRQLLCWQQLASHFLRLLGNYPLEASSRAPPFATRFSVAPADIPSFVKFALVELLVHARIFETHNVWLWLRAHLTFHDLLFSVSCLKKNLMFMQHVLLLTTWSVSCFGSNHLCRSSFIFFHSPFVSMLNTLKFWHIIVTSQFSKDSLSQLDWRHLLLVCGILTMRFQNHWSW